MSHSEEDSDATVLEEDAAASPQAQGSQFAPPCSLHVSESPGATASPPPSPSILHSSLKHLLQQRCSSTRNLTTDMEESKDQCSDDDMSQEFPPLPTSGMLRTGPQPVDTQGATQDTQIDEPSKDNPNVELTVQSVSTMSQPLRVIEVTSQIKSSSEQPTSTNPSPLEAIAQKQTILLQILKRLTLSKITDQQLTQVKAQAASFEQSLETIGTANQTERKRLAQAHSTLSQRVTSQQELVLESQALQRQLLSLTKKQKHLLECVSRQKEIRAQLASLPKTTTTQLAVHPKTTTTQKKSTDTQATVTEMSQNVQPSMASLHVSTNTLSVLPTTATNVQLRPEMLLKPVAVKTTSSADLGESVPLDTLIKHGFIQPGPNTLSCLILGCQFKTSLLTDGTLQISRGETVYHQPQHWVKACWAQLGHPNKKIAKKLAYTTVLYKETPLISYCDEYSIKQVSSYLSQRTADGGTDSRKVNSRPVPGLKKSQISQATSVSSAVTTSAPQPQATDCAAPHTSAGTFNLGQLLREGSVLLLPPVVRGCSTSLTLPQGFWSNREVSLTPQLVSQIQSDLEW